MDITIAICNFWGQVSTTEHLFILFFNCRFLLYKSVHGFGPVTFSWWFFIPLNVRGSIMSNVQHMHMSFLPVYIRVGQRSQTDIMNIALVSFFFFWNLLNFFETLITNKAILQLWTRWPTLQFYREHHIYIYIYRPYCLKRKTKILKIVFFFFPVKWTILRLYMLWNIKQKYVYLQIAATYSLLPMPLKSLTLPLSALVWHGSLLAF